MPIPRKPGPARRPCAIPDDLLDGTLTYYYQEAEIGGRQINHQDSFGTGEYESAHRFVEPSDRKNELTLAGIGR